MMRLLEHDWFPQPLPDNVQIGEGSWLHSTYAFLHYCSRRNLAVRIGRQTGIYRGTFIDLGPEGHLDIGDYCTIVGAIIVGNTNIRIGDYSFIAHEVVMADHALAAPPNVQRPGAAPGADIIIDRNVWIGARAIILGGSHIGQGAIIGAGCVVAGDVPPYKIAAGNPMHIRPIPTD